MDFDKQHGIAETIRYGYTMSPLGIVLAASSSVGMCAVAFGDTEAELLLELHGRFPAAVLRHDEAAVAGHLQAIVRSLQVPQQTGLHLPLDLRGTAFQRAVWQALQTIPRGDTRTYSELAALLGVPSGARAVAGACARNPLALVVPCHRVVGSRGALSGYRWGLHRKQQLLHLEGARPGLLPADARLN